MEIELTNGMVALVDQADAGLARFTWHAMKCTKVWYAFRYVGPRGSRKAVFMHRSIMRARRGQLIDHENGNGLDNQRKNLRFANRAQNTWNNTRAPGRHGYKGVAKQGRKYQASIKCKDKRVHLGMYPTAKEAAAAFDGAARVIRGKFATLNVKRGRRDSNPQPPARQAGARTN